MIIIQLRYLNWSYMYMQYVDQKKFSINRNNVFLFHPKWKQNSYLLLHSVMIMKQDNLLLNIVWSIPNTFSLSFLYSLSF